MKTLATYQRRVFLKDHPPVTQRSLLASNGTERTLLAGTVLGIKEGSLDAFSAEAAPHSILAEDIVIPATGDAYTLVYTHAAVITPELIWLEGISAQDQQTALAALRSQGIYASEA